MRLNAQSTGKSRSASQIDRASRPKRKKAGERGVQLPAPFVDLPSATSLNLPYIGDVAPKLVNQKSVASTSKIALSMLDLGLACDEDAALAATPALFVQQVFARWVKERTGNIKIFRPILTLTDSLQQLVDGESSNDNLPAFAVGVSFDYEDSVYYSLKEKIEHLENVVPGLGETAVSRLSTWASRTMMAITPSFVHFLVQNEYWFGEDDEKGYFENMMEMGEEVEDCECPVTLAQFQKEFPKFIYAAGEKISRTQLEELTNHNDSLVAATAKVLLLQPDSSKWNPTYLEDLANYHDCVSYGLVLNWEKGGSDIANQVCNDWMENVYNAGSTTDLYVVYLSGQNTDELQKLFLSLEQYINALEWVERAITTFTSIES